MSYPEPFSATNEVCHVSSSESRVSLIDSSEHRLDIRHLEGVGWEIELRHDLHVEQIDRQPFTGMQSTLTATNISFQENPEQIQLSAGPDSLWIQRSDLSFTCQEESRTLFRTAPRPFSIHTERVTLSEGIMSLKVTDFSDRNPLGPEGKKFSSHMVRFQYPRPEGQVLGLPGQTGELNRNGYRYTLYNTDMFVHTPDRPPMYQSWPILMHRGLGGAGWVCVFHDNPSRTFVDLGDFYEDRVTFESVTGNTRLYVLTADSLDGLSAKIMTLLGDACIPPAWAFGYQQCRWSYMSTDEVRTIARSMREQEIPCDALYFDIDYMDGFRVFTTDQLRFADLRACLDELHAEDFKSVCIVDPGVKIDPDYPVYTELKKKGAFLQKEGGDEFVGKVWPGEAVYPDFGDEQVVSEWAALQKDWLEQYPFDGVWNDMNEPSNFDGQNHTTKEAFTRRGPLEKEFNLYGYHMAYASQRGWQATNPDRRGVVITRAGYPGVQRHAVIWHGDNQAWWEHLRLALDTALSYSICGALYTGPDVPGFTGNPTDDLAVRFYQLGAFLPLYRGHSIYFARDKEPFAFHPLTCALIKQAILLRYSLLREWYTGYLDAVSRRAALMKPVFAAESVVRDQFLLFDNLLVAPVIERDQQQRLLYLPEGLWYRLGDTENAIEGNCWHVEAVGLDSIPIFVRGGTVLTRNTPRQSAQQTLAAAELFEAYPDVDGSCSGIYFSDDGISSDTGSGKWFQLQVTDTGVEKNPWQR